MTKSAWSYFEASDESRITGARARKYYYGDIRRGQCRVGTFIYRQSMRQLERFLGGARQDHYIHVDPPACRGVSLKDDMLSLIHICMTSYGTFVP